jgi:hypothetical protein
MRVENLGNKIFLITLLCAGLGLFLYVRPFLFAKDPPPRLVDRLPEAEFIGRAQIFDLARESNSMLFKQKVPFREYLTADFLLSQAKNFGVDVQDPLYFFSNGDDEWGGFITLTDSSKLLPGINRISQFFTITDTVVLKTKLKHIEQLDVFIHYDKHYAFVYKGKKLKERLARAIYAKFGQTSTTWRRFKRINTFKKESFVVYSQHPALKKYAIDYGLMAFSSDSTEIKLKTFVHSSYELKIKEKEKGPNFEINGNPETAAQLHLDISEFRKSKKHPLYKLLVDFGKKISFPTDVFLTAWDGDLSYVQGGTQMIEEEYIEMGVDEEFNPVEVRKTKQVPIKGFSAMISVNDAGQELVSRLFAKGILNKQGNRYRFLFSPPVRLNVQPTFLSAYTSNGSPKIVDGATNFVMWKYKGIKVTAELNRIKKSDVFGTIHIDAVTLLRHLKLIKT